MLFLNNILPDGGPWYTETNIHFIIAEPFNAVSSLAYLIPAFYWFYKLKGQYRQYPILTICLPFLFLGGIGSTLYHAFRNSAFFLFLDVFPIAIVTLLISIYFWIKVLKKWWHISFILVPFIIFRYLLFDFISYGSGTNSNANMQTSINISYFITGVMIFLPALLLLIKNNFRHYLSMLGSCLFFILGLFLREADSWNIFLFPMGTHWLWHISTAIGSSILGFYLFCLRNDELEKQLA